jgi:hypothetical protein
LKFLLWAVESERQAAQGEPAGESRAIRTRYWLLIA